MALLTSTVMILLIFVASALSATASWHQSSQSPIEIQIGDSIQAQQLEILKLLKEQGATLDNLQQQCFGKQDTATERAAPLTNDVVDQECLFIDERAKADGITKAIPVHIQCDRLENVAPGKDTFSSSVHEPASYATNKAIDADDGSFYHSVDEANPWWMIDLGSQKTIFAIMILSRQDCCPERFHDVEIRLGNSLQTEGTYGSHKLLQYYKGPYSLDQGTLMYAFSNGVTGQYLSIKMATEGDLQVLQINDVKIIALRN